MLQELAQLCSANLEWRRTLEPKFHEPRQQVNVAQVGFNRICRKRTLQLQVMLKMANMQFPHTQRYKFRFVQRLPYLLFVRSEEHTSELQSRENLVCRLLLEKKN